MPHAPGARSTKSFTALMGFGRTVSVLQPDNSKKQYSYLVNTVTVTDEAGKWKKHTMDVYGNLAQVTEPDPDNPATATYVTSYAYDLLNHLTTVTMLTAIRREHSW